MTIAFGHVASLSLGIPVPQLSQGYDFSPTNFDIFLYAMLSHLLWSQANMCLPWSKDTSQTMSFINQLFLVLRNGGKCGVLARESVC